MDIEITETTGRRTATATLRSGAIQVRVPRHWPKGEKEETVRTLVRRVLAMDAKNKALLEKLLADDLSMPLPGMPTGPARITLNTVQALWEYVDRINRETFQVPVRKVRIGSARYTRLAQINLTTGVMTVSRYCLNNVPESGLRYLIVHELAHFFEANHSKRFWALVARHVPDYEKQSKLMKAFYHQAVEQAQH